MTKPNPYLITEKQVPPSTTAPIWLMPFRPFFAGATLFSVFAIALWWASLQGYLSISVYGNWLWWHSHEMIFGFASAIIIGFLLTAVQTWTGISGVRGKALAALFIVWLSARIAMFFPLPVTLVTLLDIAFLPITALLLAYPLLKTRMYRNLIFLVILLTLTGLNIASHFALINNSNPAPYFHSAIMLIVLVVTVMGGRVIPLFTGNALKIKIALPPKYVELTAIISILTLIIFAMVGFSSIPVALKTSVALIGFIAHSTRLFYWFNKGILNKPLLWSLHLAYSFIPLGLLLMCLQAFDTSITTSLIIHGFTVGGIGGIILAMISRVCLGHTGRPLILPKLMPVALVAIFLGGVIRSMVPWVDMKFYSLALTSSALCWGIAFGLFVVIYLPFLLSARADGK